MAEKVYCGWFARCMNVAEHVVRHPILGWVPTCEDCTKKLDLHEYELRPAKFDFGVDPDDATSASLNVNATVPDPEIATHPLDTLLDYEDMGGMAAPYYGMDN